MKMPRERSNYNRKSFLRNPSLIVFACEGARTELGYFEGISSLVDRSISSRVKLKILKREDETLSSPLHVIKQLDDYKKAEGMSKKDMLCMVIDKDSWPEQALATVARECQQKGYVLAVSNPCFETWLLSHFQPLDIDPNNQHNKHSLRALIIGHTGAYNPSNLDFSVYAPHIQRACENARTADTIPDLRWPNPLGTRVYIMLEEILPHLN